MHKVLSIIIGFTCVFFVLIAVTAIIGAYQTGVKIKEQEQAQQQLEKQRQLVADHNCYEKSQPLMGYNVPRANITAYNAEPCGTLLPLPPSVLAK